MAGFYFEITNAAPRSVKKNVAASEDKEAKFTNNYFYYDKKWDEEAFQACIRALAINQRAVDVASLRAIILRLIAFGNKADMAKIKWTVRDGKKFHQLGFGYSEKGGIEEAMSNVHWFRIK